MKIVLFGMLLFSSVTFAGINLEVDFNISGKKSHINKKIDFDKKYIHKFNDGRIEYTLSSKRPVGYPSKYLWGEDSVHLEAKIYDINGVIISSPQVSTVLGQDATLEIFEEKNPKKLETKIVFKPTKI